MVEAITVTPVYYLFGKVALAKTGSFSVSLGGKIQHSFTPVGLEEKAQFGKTSNIHRQQQ